MDSEYYIQKAKYAKKLHDEGRPFVKVYAPVRDGDKFIVLKIEHPNGEIEYQISGGGVDEGETLEEAIKRELLEELNVEVEVLRELGVYDKLQKTWRLNGEEFLVQYEVHVFDTRLKKQLSGNMGLEGEFQFENSVKIARIDKETLLSNVTEFKKFGIKFPEDQQ